jgi:hypothetical protein
LPADGRSAALRRAFTAKEDPPHRHDRALIWQKFLWFSREAASEI